MTPPHVRDLLSRGELRLVMSAPSEQGGVGRRVARRDDPEPGAGTG